MIGEPALELAERHVAEGAERVAKQKARIEKMMERGTTSAEVLGLARSSLATLEETQRLAIAHLRMAQRADRRALVQA
jgi:hypothetical protein